MLTGNSKIYRQCGSVPPSVQFDTVGKATMLNVLSVNSTKIDMKIDQFSPMDRCPFWASVVYTGR